MRNMFGDTWSLRTLDLPSFDARNGTDIHGMFRNTTALRQITLGENIVSLNGTEMPQLFPFSTIYTGCWQNVGTGTIEDPQGNYALTSDELMEQFNGGAMADTWVWQRHPA